MHISFLVPVRQRSEDLVRLRDYVLPHILAADCECLTIHESAYCTPSLVESLSIAGARSFFVNQECDQFHKTRLLNLLLARVNGKYVIPFDSDLLPLFSIRKLVRLVISSPSLVLGGYRLMSGHLALDPCKPSALALPTSAPEDCTGAIYKQLARGESFLVCPAFQTNYLVDIGGWDERFIGWGCEDQDILERYQDRTGFTPARSSDLLYLHYDHPPSPGWNDDGLVQANRSYYYSR